MIRSEHGSIEQLKSNFSAAALGMSSSGWIWFVTDTNGRTAVLPTFGAGTLLVRSRANASPMPGPVLGEDVGAWRSEKHAWLNTSSTRSPFASSKPQARHPPPPRPGCPAPMGHQPQRTRDPCNGETMRGACSLHSESPCSHPCSHLPPCSGSIRYHSSSPLPHRQHPPNDRTPTLFHACFLSPFAFVSTRWPCPIPPQHHYSGRH
jgi:hypothetical protein